MQPQKPNTLNSTLSHLVAEPLAVLSATHESAFGIAVCSLANISIDENGISPRVMLMPDGAFKSHNDNRPTDVPSGHWFLDEQAWHTISAFAAQRTNDYHFDYEHQTLKAEENGQPAPASGWFKPDALEYVAGEGLFALNVRWTKKAAAMLKSDEYRFISPVFHYDLNTGRPTKLRHFALTNDPAVDGMDKVIALKTQTSNGVQPMNEALRLLAALGVTVEDGQTPTDAQFSQATTAVAALKAKAASADDAQAQLTTANEQVAALKASNGNKVDLTQYVPISVAQGYQQELAALRSQNDGLSIDQLIEDARSDGRVIAAEVDYLKDLAKQSGVAVLKANLDARSPIAALTSQQSSSATPNKDKQDPVAALTSDEKYAAEQLGISHADFAKSKQENS